MMFGMIKNNYRMIRMNGQLRHNNVVAGSDNLTNT